MNSDCEKIKDQIADLVTGILPEAQVHELEQHLNECAACRDYARALKDEDMLLTEFFAKIDTNITHQQERVLQAINRSDVSKQSETHLIWRTIMKNPITKLAAAAVILVGVGLGGLLLHSSSQITWADVIEQMRNVKTVRYLLIKQSADASSDRPDSFRTDDIRRIFKDQWQATWLWEGLSRFTADEVKIVGTEQLNGVETILFAGPINVVVADSGKSFTGGARVWVDSQSAIPLRLIIEYTDDKAIRHRTTLEEIQWNAE